MTSAGAALPPKEANGPISLDIIQGIFAWRCHAAVKTDLEDGARSSLGGEGDQRIFVRVLMVNIRWVRWVPSAVENRPDSGQGLVQPTAEGLVGVGRSHGRRVSKSGTFEAMLA